MAFVSLRAVQALERHQLPWQSDRSGTVHIYVLVDPADGLVRYVGKTQTHLRDRLDRHLASQPNPHMYEWIKRLRKRRARPRIVGIQDVSEREWQRAERAWIAWFRERGDLLNIEDGGSTRGVYKHYKGRRYLTQREKDRREIAAKSGPVRSLSREEIERLYGKGT